MPLRDHFHPPLSEWRHWESFHARWAAVIADFLEADLLPPGYFAEVQVHLGNRIEVDIASFAEESSQNPNTQEKPSNASQTTTVTAPVWSPPEPVMVWPAVFLDRLEILIFQSEVGPTLVAAIELVSPGNKDRSESRRAFAVKCANYLHHGIGFVLVDVVTNRHANLHNEIVDILGLNEKDLPTTDSLFALSYRSVQEGETPVIQVWPFELAVGEDLPTLPLPLDKGQCLRLNLEETYAEACRRTRLPEE